MTVQVTPVSNENPYIHQHKGTNKTVTGSRDAKGLRMSIKLCMIVLVSSLVLLTVSVLTLTWLSSFVPTVLQISQQTRETRFNSIVSYVDNMLDKISVFNKMTGQELLSHDYDISKKTEEQSLYANFKVSQEYLKEVAESVFIVYADGSSCGVGFGLTHDDIVYTATRDGQFLDLFDCEDFTNQDQCKRNSTPTLVLTPFDNSYIIGLCDSNPGKQFYALSSPQPTLMTTEIILVNCMVFPPYPFVGNHKFHFFLGSALTMKTVSAFLISRTKEITNSKGFIIETQTGFIITADSTTELTGFNEKGEVDRKTALTTSDARIVSTSKAILATYSKWTSIKCNQYLDLQEVEYVSVYRLCTETKIDWVIVLAEPKWNTLGTTIIAIISSLVGTALVFALSLAIGIIVSLKIVRPFLNLAKSFEDVSNMELESLRIQFSSFVEVKKLQEGFLDMVERMKLYKSFIPVHLLDKLQIDEEHNHHLRETIGGMSETTSSVNTDVQLKKNELESKKDSAFSFKNRKMNNKFSLYLDEKMVTFVHVYMDGLDECFKQLNVNEMVSTLSDIFDQIQNIIKSQGGYSSNFENRTLTISFNSATDISAHEDKALNVANLLLQKLSGLQSTKWSSKIHQKKVVFRMGILSQTCFCGNIGTSAVKTFSILGSSKANLEKIIESAKRLNVSIAMDPKVKKASEKNFQSRLIDTIGLFEDLHMAPSSIDLTDEKLTQCFIYELGPSTKVSEDEWMYELQEKKKLSQWDGYNVASELFIGGKYEDALDAFNNFYQKNPLDLPSQHLINMCLAKLDQ